MLNTNNKEGIREILDKIPTRIDKIKDKYQYNLIHQATKKGSAAMINTIVDYARNTSKLTQDEVEIWVNEYIENSTDGRTSIHIAAFANALEAIRALESHGAKIDQKSKKGLNGLHFAAQGNSVKALYFFHKHIDINSQDEEGNTPLHYAYMMK